MNLLAPNFTLAELTVSQTGTRLGLDNTPTPEIIGNLRGVATRILQPVRDHYGKPVMVYSGYRSPKVNAACKGAKHSQHMLGQAADFVIHGLPNAELASWIFHNLKFDQLILEFNSPTDPYAGWVHCSWVPAGRQQYLAAARGAFGVTKYTTVVT